MLVKPDFFPAVEYFFMKCQVVIDGVLVTTPEKTGCPERMKLIVGSNIFNIANLECFVFGFTIANPEYRIAQITLAFAMVEFDSARYASYTGGRFVFWGLQEAGFTPFECDQHLVAPSDGCFQRFGFAAPQFVRKIAAAFFAASNDSNLKAKYIRFGDVLILFHFDCSKSKKSAYRLMRCR
jgi:hypothetical protein